MPLLTELGWVPEPAIVLMGCRPWPPARTPGAPCPVCGGAIRPDHRSTHCAWCDASAPAIESRCLAARIGLVARDAAESAEREYRDGLRRRDLTESERRRIWYGYSRKGYESGRSRIVNLARVGREWLAELGQEPDWSLVLDSHGRVVGHREPEPEVVA